MPLTTNRGSASLFRSLFRDSGAWTACDASAHALSTLIMPTRTWPMSQGESVLWGCLPTVPLSGRSEATRMLIYKLLCNHTYSVWYGKLWPCVLIAARPRPRPST